jgi:hypothetical protein
MVSRGRPFIPPERPKSKIGLRGHVFMCFNSQGLLSSTSYGKNSWRNIVYKIGALQRVLYDYLSPIRVLLKGATCKSISKIATFDPLFFQILLIIEEKRIVVTFLDIYSWPKHVEMVEKDDF